MSAVDPAEPQRLTDFEYELPPERIAQEPAPGRRDSRLLVLGRRGPYRAEHGTFRDITRLVRGDELIVLNDTRVVPARLLGNKPTGGAVELLVLGARPDRPGQWTAMGRSSKPLRPGTAVVLDAGATVTVEEPLGGGRYAIALPCVDGEVWAFLDRHGALPLPPYIRRPSGPSEADRTRYQTVYATEPGAVAAPTAGLHFDRGLLDELAARGCEIARVTLHVGPGTFQPVRVADISRHRMETERYVISPESAAAVARAKEGGRPVLAVGTTVVRTLEGSARAHGMPVAEESETDIFIRPGSPFRVVDQLITNFHLPGSTLLMLVSAFAGRERVLRAYREAVSREYRFYSYGDAMLIR